MKKICSVIIALACTLNLLADSVLINGLYYSFGQTTAQVEKDPTTNKIVYSAYTSVIIPDSVMYDNYIYPVKSMGTSAFEALTELRSVTLPNTITSIGTDAFYGCTKLSSVNLPEGLKTIGLRAFYNCRLTSVTIPSTVTSIGNVAFKGNPLTSVTWLPLTCSIGITDNSPFYSTNSQITSFTFGNQVELVPASICYNMSLLDTIVLPASVYRLGERAFMYCTSLRSINLPVTQQTLPVSFFEGCTALDSIHLPATLKTVSQDAFYGCTSLSKVNLDEGLTTIGERAFYNCKLTSVTIPSTVTSIGNVAFKGNPLTSVTWLPPTCSIGTTESAPFYSTNSQITSFTFGEQVELVPASICYNMSRIDTIVLPASVYRLGERAFMYCSSLKSINLPVTQQTLPVSFFEGCTSLDSIHLPTTLKTISQDAFYGCTSLSKVNFEEGLTTIGLRAFSGCSSLKKIIIPSTVTTINQNAFYNCSGLQQIYNYAMTPQTIVQNTLYNVNKTTCVLYVPIDFIDLYQAEAVWRDFYNIIGVATGLYFDDQEVTVTYLKQDQSPLYMEQQNWKVPFAPRIQGFTFLRWEVQPGNLADGIVLQAIYQSDEATDALTVTNPANPAQKLIRHGDVYILRDEHLYTIKGQKIQ